MKSLDEQVGAASDDLGAAPVIARDAPARIPAASMAVGRPRRKAVGRAVGASILIALATMVYHLVTDGIQNTAEENAAIAKLNPTSSYNDKLSTALAARRGDLKRAQTTLNQAVYLERSSDYLALDWALLDAQDSLNLNGVGLLSKVTKAEYQSTIADADKSLVELEAARLAVVADMAATPAPASTARPS